MSTRQPSAPLRFAATVLVFLALEALVFHTELYPSILEPDSSTGSLEYKIRNERVRVKNDRKQVLAVGHSRMALMPKVANELQPATGYTFATIGEPGATQRDWYYMLRNVDPDHNKYAAIIVPSDDYDDVDGWEDLGDRPTDMFFLNARLEMRDLSEFPGSYTTPERQQAAFRAILFKGLAFQRDFQDFLTHPRERLKKVAMYRKDSAQWNYEYPGDPQTAEGLEIDWSARQVVQYPPTWGPDLQQTTKNVLLAEPAPQTGRYTRYLLRWLGKIEQEYRGSGTKLIFIRLPRAPVINPTRPPFKADSAFRTLAKQPDTILSDEHLFDELERPALFKDPMHLNGPGSRRFTEILARHVQAVLGGAH